jgi:hypothetical protein
VIVQRIVGVVTAVSAAAAAAGVVVVAASFGVFSLLQGYVGPSAAAAIIAAVLAVALAVAAVFMLGRAKMGGEKASLAVPPDEQALPQRVVYMLRERPILAAGAAVAAGLIAWRNPKIAASVMSLFALGRERA